MNRQEFDELSAGYAMNALTPEDQAAFEAARIAHPEWQQRVSEDHEIVASLADTTAIPPDRLRASLLSAIIQTPQEQIENGNEFPELNVAPSTLPAIQPRHRARAWFALAASLALLLVIGYGAVSLNQLVNRPAEVIALDEIAAAADARTASADVGDSGSVTVRWSADAHRAVVETHQLPPIGDDQDFELWLVRADGPVSVGVFRSDDSRATVLLDRDIQPGDAVAISIEPVGGSPTGAPTSDPIVVIPTA